MRTIVHAILGFLLILGCLIVMAFRGVAWGFNHASDAIVDTFSVGTPAADARAVQEANEAQQRGRDVAVISNEANMRQMAANGYETEVKEKAVRKPTKFDDYANAFILKNKELIGDRFDKGVGSVSINSPAYDLKSKPEIRCSYTQYPGWGEAGYSGSIVYESATYSFSSKDGSRWIFCGITDGPSQPFHPAHEGNLNTLISIAKEVSISIGN